MCTEIQIDNITKAMAQEYRNVYGNDIVDILLFGSYARGDFDSESDIDIVAIVRGNREPLQKKLKLLWDASADIGLENDVIVSPTVIPYEEFIKHKSILPYYKNIEKEGIKIG